MLKGFLLTKFYIVGPFKISPVTALPNGSWYNVVFILLLLTCWYISLTGSAVKIVRCLHINPFFLNPNDSLSLARLLLFPNG